MWMSKSYSLGAPVVDMARRSARFTITAQDPELDCSGDEVVTAGISWDRWLANPAVGYMHDTKEIVGTSWNGRSVDLTVGPDSASAVCYFGKTALANEVFDRVCRGELRSASIGFSVQKARPNGRRERGLKIDRCEVHEWSIVGVGCNAKALIETKSACGHGCGCGRPGCVPKSRADIAVTCQRLRIDALLLQAELAERQTASVLAKLVSVVDRRKGRR